MARSDTYRYLPFLSSLLLVAIAALAVRLHLKQPPRATRLRLAAFQAVLELIPEYYDDTDADRLFQAAMRGAVESLDDAWSRYLTPDRRRESDIDARGRVEGIGVLMAPAGEYAVITDLLPGGAAGEAQLRPGDVIIGVNGRRVPDMTFPELTGAIRGRPGSTVELTVRDPRTERDRRIALERRRLDIAPVELQFPSDRIALVKLQTVSDAAVDALRDLLTGMDANHPVDALILDLRDNPGGVLNNAVEIADMFLQHGPIATIRHVRTGQETTYHAGVKTLLAPDRAMAVLVNERSASAAELLAGALQCHRRAQIIGAPTVGKGAVEGVFALPDGSGLVLRIATFTAGRSVVVDRHGVQPDITVGRMPPAPSRPDPDRQQQWLRDYEQARAAQNERAIEALRDLLGREDDP